MTNEPTIPDGYSDVPHAALRWRPRRKAIARNLEMAAQVPALTSDMQIDLTVLLEVRESWAGSHKPSILACVAKASVDALREYPALNATYTDRYSLQWGVVNLAIAVDTPEGLVTPVIRNAAAYPVDQLGAEIAKLAEAARAGSLSVDDLRGGTFTISNPGSIGPSLRAEALLNLPQVALLGLPGIKRVPLVVGAGEDERVEIRTVIVPSLTFDHRAMDGAETLRYLGALRERIENWQAADYLAGERAISPS